MADAISLYLDTTTPQGALVRGLNDRNPVALGPFYQKQLLPLRIYPVSPTGNGVLHPYFSKTDLDGLEIQVVVGPAAGAEAIKAAQYTWSKQLVADADGESGYFYANLDLATSELDTLIGSSSTVTTQFEIQLSRAGSTFRPVFQTDITIKAVVKDPASAAVAPAPAVDYYTAAQIRQLFVPWDNRLFSVNYGRSIITVSPDGSHTREVGGVDNDGSPTDNLT